MTFFVKKLFKFRFTRYGVKRSIRSEYGPVYCVGGPLRPSEIELSYQFVRVFLYLPPRKLIRFLAPLIFLFNRWKSRDNLTDHHLSRPRDF
jgi:hypothetical protein